MSQDRHDRAAEADSGRPRGQPSSFRGHRGGWGPRSSRGRRQQCKLSAMFLPFDVHSFILFLVVIASVHECIDLTA